MLNFLCAHTKMGQIWCAVHLTYFYSETLKKGGPEREG